MTAPAQSGYTLPVFACAAAVAAVQWLKHQQSGEPSPPGITHVTLDLLEPALTVSIPIEQAALLSETSALAITRSQPGDNLDLTRHTPVWAYAQYLPGDETLIIQGGEGIGKQIHREQQPAIYRYAQRLLHHHLIPYLLPHQTLVITLILPEGRNLATRTSNAAFGVVEGLSLLGTSGIAQPLSAPQQLADFQTQLTTLAQHHRCLVFCLGENGLDLAQQWGVNADQRLKTANWLGPLLIAAAEAGIEQILLLGYHGKLIKLAGGIFHTHHHLADARLEILTAQAAEMGLPQPQLQQLLHAPTTEAGLGLLRTWQTAQHHPWVNIIYQQIADTIDRRSEAYIYKLSSKNLTVGSLLFDGDRQPLALSEQGTHLAQTLGLTLPPLPPILP
ncbi:MAG: cobalt-precorrin-5B (C(1))-methyltransferase CbiD [Synechocystis sp.]|nr:cobalt-precorrin-5B (C(1))-methyltransferase CbiD [Synechocystis sp.]